MLQPLEPARCEALCAWARGLYKLHGMPEGLRQVSTASHTPQEVAQEIVEAINRAVQAE